MKKNFRIAFVDHGIANRFSGKYIEVNRKLLRPEYEPLFFELLNHEMQHTDRGYTLKDIKLDTEGFKNKWLYYKFIITTPSSWNQFFPFYKSRGRWVLDLGLLWTWFIAAMVTGILSLWIIIRLFS